VWQLLDAQSKKDDCKVGSRRCFCGSFAEIGCVEKFSTFSLFKLLVERIHFQQTFKNSMDVGTFESEFYRVLKPTNFST